MGANAHFSPTSCQPLCRHDRPRLAVHDAGRAWAMDADGNPFGLFLPVLTSNLDQLHAAYEKALPRQPERFLLG